MSFAGHSVHLSQNGLQLVSGIGLCERMALRNVNMAVNGEVNVRHVENG